MPITQKGVTKRFAYLAELPILWYHSDKVEPKRLCFDAGILIK